MIMHSHYHVPSGRLMVVPTWVSTGEDGTTSKPQGFIMASCIKCGKRRLNKDAQGRFKCSHCGPMKYQDFSLVLTGVPFEHDASLIKIPNFPREPKFKPFSMDVGNESSSR